jgi:uncharacterized protein (DUF2147 family)
MKTVLSALIRLFPAVLLLPALAQGGELAGLWQEFDDQTGKVEALIRIEKTPAGDYEGKIETLAPNLAGKVCDRCTGMLNNKPLLGMRILYGMKRQDELNFEGGEILDPDEGKTYRCHIKMSEDGKTLEVTGYIGAKWLGQTEIWRRAE